MLEILQTLVTQIGLSAVFAIIVTQSKNVRRVLGKKKRRFREHLLLILFFGTFGIISTYMGVPVKGAIANSRVVGVFVAGLIGGPLVGLFSGLLAGLHRWVFDIGGFTAIACMLSTILEGLFGGLLNKRFVKAEEKWLFALSFGAIAETIQMVIILIFARPFEDALGLVSIIAMPMIVANSIGISIFIAIIENVKKDFELIAANQAEIVLEIANKTIQYFRKGLNKKTAQKISQIVLDSTDIDAVAFTDNKIVLAQVDRKSVQKIDLAIPISNKCMKVVKQNRVYVANSRDDIGTDFGNFKFNSAVFAPISLSGEVVGVLKLFRAEEKINQVDIKLAKGLSSLFSTQIELSMIDQQRKLIVQAELKALQAQINPHFLFNAINTIVSLIRTNPEEARGLLQQLSLFFRNSFQFNKEEVGIHREIEHIRAYLELEKARFGDRLKVNYSIPESLECYLPPFLLQPIVENAVKHGVMVRRKEGEINISAKTFRKGIIITIEDNGVGIEKEKIAYILSEKSGVNSALKNIKKRLELKYGDNAELSISSKKNIGTCVTIIIPKKVEE